MFQIISMRQLEWHMANGTRMTLLDVREPEEFERGHLKGAWNIPLEELEERAGELPQDRPIAVYCMHGNRSLMAGRLLDEMGFHVMAAAGGLASYRGRFYVDRHL